MRMTAAITVYRSREEVERRWRQAEHVEHLTKAGATVTFADAPGDRGTEIHVDLGQSASRGAVVDVARNVLGAAPLARVKDDLRRFKQLVETGVIARSDAVPEGETAVRKLKTHPAQPLNDAELEKAGV